MVPLIGEPFNSDDRRFVSRNYVKRAIEDGANALHEYDYLVLKLIWGIFLRIGKALVLRYSVVFNTSRRTLSYQTQFAEYIFTASIPLDQATRIWFD